MSDKKKVLIVDNELHWLELLAELLINEYEVTTAKNLAEARDALLTSNRPFHVVISEIRLEASDQTNEEGLQLLGDLNQISSSTQAIVITGYPNIRTAKKSWRDLDVFEYMLKFPEDGQGFDYDRFRKVVREAVNQAEKQRPTAFVQQNNKALVVEDDMHWYNYLGAILESEEYEVDRCNNLHELLNLLVTNSYQLIVLNNHFLKQESLLLAEIRENQTDVEILLTARSINITKALEAVQDRRIFSVITLDDSFNEQRFRSIIYRALDPRARKYVLASFKETIQDKQLQAGQSYNLVITMQSKPTTKGASVRLSPRALRFGAILKIMVYAQDMDIHPDKNVYWEIPAHTAPEPIEFSVMPNPKFLGEKSIIFDFEEGRLWRGRLTKEVDVNSKTEELNLRRERQALVPALELEEQSQL